MDIHKLEYFMKVCEMKTVSRAADKLFISQQALSKSIASLEDELGVKLFERTPHGLALTRSGETLRKEAGAFIRYHEGMVNRVQQARSETTETVTISFFSGMLSEYPKGFFEELMEQFPETEFRWFSYPENNQGRHFTSQDADLLFTTEQL